MVSLPKTDTPGFEQSLTARAALPLGVFLIGAAIAAIASAADLLGIKVLAADQALSRQWLWIGLALLAAGAVMDSTFGKKYLFAALKSHLADWPGLLKFLAIAVQLSLLVVVMRMSYLEHSAFYNNVMLLTLYGFIIHYFLPLPYRLPFFLILSLAGIVSVFGWVDGAWLIGLSLVLIGICHLPIGFWPRVAILLVAAAVLIVMRLGYLPAPWTKALWPIVASMFMFRMMIYLYDLKHKKVSPGGMGWARSLSYFFLLPNVAFPLFPVVDYSTFCRTYYDDDQYRIYQRGLRWIFWGAVHLLIYRCINYYWLIGAEGVKDTATLVQYMAANYLYVIRLSGQFHLAVGILHLFGFNLPRIMERYLLATDFTDYWRRVNVYWKEFIQKVFYYPAYFKMRRVGNTTKLALATLLGFAMTWFFHSYQWFWIRGTFMLSVPDILFWSSMGALVLANSLYEARHGRKRALVKRAATLGEIAAKTWRAAGIFVVMMVLWSIWISASLADWAALVAGAELTLPGVLAALGVIVVVLGVATFVYEKWPALTSAAREKEISFFRLAAPLASAIVLLYLLAQPEFYVRLGPQASHLIADLRTNRLNAQDEALLQKGYYEKLTDVNQFNTDLAKLYAQRPEDWRPLTATAAIRFTDDFLRYELVPLLDGSIKDASFETNRWGMRDDDCEQTPAPGTYRIAMLGGSVELGSGLLHEEIFEALLEKRLNREHAGAKSGYAKYEVLNFAVGGYHLLQHIITHQNKVRTFKPNAVLYVAHGSESGEEIFKSAQTPARLDPEEIPYPGLQEILRRAGVMTTMKTTKIVQRLEPFSEEILLWGYEQIAADCRQQGILPIWIGLPTWPGIDDSARVAKLVPIAERAGFVALNLAEVYDSQKGAFLQLASWDKHPNARGHWLIADGLYQALRENAGRLPMLFSANAPATVAQEAAKPVAPNGVASKSE